MSLKMQALYEATGHIKKSIAIRDGKKVVITKRVYATECPDGYKRDPETGKCVRMSAEERRNRSLAAKRSANKASTKRNRAISLTRRDSLIQEATLSPHNTACYKILMALGANSGTALKNLERLLGDFGIDADSVYTISDLASSLSENEARDVLKWIEDNNLKIGTK